MSVLFPSWSVSDEHGTCQAELEVTLVETNKLQVRGTCISEQKRALRYLLIATRSGTSGRATSSQGGAFETSDGETVSFCRVQFNALPEDTFLFTLKIFERDREVAVVRKEFTFI